jgi:hypothetical protein
MYGQFMGRDAGDACLRRIIAQHLPDSLLAQAFRNKDVSPVHRSEYVTVRDAGRGCQLLRRRSRCGDGLLRLVRSEILAFTAMEVAFLFDCQALDGMYGYAVTRLILETGVLQASERHMRVSRGEILTANIARSTGQPLVDVCKHVYTPRELDLLILGRTDTFFRCARVWCWRFQNATDEIARRMHEELLASPAYRGAMDVDFSDPFHLRCFRNSLPEVYRVMGRRCWLFYHMGEDWAVDSATKEIFEENGFTVDCEDLGARGTIFDNYDALEHFRRVGDFNRVFARFEGLDSDKVSDLTLLLEEIHPKLFDALASAARTLERAETGEDLAQAALSGRRLLEKTADYLYPARDGKRKARDVGSRSYKNRLWAYIEDTLLETGLETSSILPRMGQEADRLVDLFNSGLHHDPTRRKVEAGFRDLVGWLTKAIQISPTHARKVYLAYEDELKRFLGKVGDSGLPGDPSREA